VNEPFDDRPSGGGLGATALGLALATVAALVVPYFVIGHLPTPSRQDSSNDLPFIAGLLGSWVSWLLVPVLFLATIFTAFKAYRTDARNLARASLGVLLGLLVYGIVDPRARPVARRADRRAHNLSRGARLSPERWTSGTGPLNPHPTPDGLLQMLMLPSRKSVFAMCTLMHTGTPDADSRLASAIVSSTFAGSVNNRPLPP
jgi:hypothetical protein